MKCLLKTSLKIIGLSYMLLIQEACSKKELRKEFEPVESVRVIQFSGFDWVVRTSKNELKGPGPNRFSDTDENVWVDEKGYLHLKITQRNGIWYCSGVTLRRSLGYGKYVFYVSGNINQLDQNVVAGLFTYKNDDEEIDIEFSKWSDPTNENAQYAIQPSYSAGNKVRFNLNSLTDYSTHAFNWTPERIDFVSLRGHNLNADKEIIHQWSYTGKDIPPHNDERLKINLWLFKGKAPNSSIEQELVIKAVEFTKMPTD